MILHTCPKCGTPGLYSVELNEDVHCRACGTAFTLTRFTKTERDAVARFAVSTRERLQAVRTSRTLVYVAGATASILVLWLAASAFGLIPDEYRLIHRRFASIADQAGLTEAVGLVAVGYRDAQEGAVFEEFYTAVAISNDGYMLTSREAVEQRAEDVWVFVGGRRLNAQVVGAGKIADFGVIKADGSFAKRFRLAGSDAISRLNVAVQAIGYEPVGKDSRSPIEWPIAITSGTVGRTYSDDVGTNWIEHSAAIGERSRGGPLVFRDRLVGLNVSSKAGITRSLALAPYRDEIFRMIGLWETAESH